jgi:putative DNA primase/helicase
MGGRERGPGDNGPENVDELPEWTEGEAEVLAAYDAAEADDAPALSDLDLAKEWTTDLGNARRFVGRHGKYIKHVENLGWLAWQFKPFVDGSGAGAGWWKLDSSEPLRRAHQVAEAMVQEAKAVKNGPRGSLSEDEHKRKWMGLWLAAQEASNHGKAVAMVKSAVPYCSLEMDDLDQTPFKINVLNGTLLLEPITETSDGVRLVAPRRTDYATKMTAVAYQPKASAPKWAKFVEEVQPNPETRAYLQRWFGYCLTGSIDEQCCLVFEGKGANGKSTMVDVIARLLKDYSVTVPIETFLHQDRKSGSNATPDLARLPGARLVRTSEPEPGARMSESTIKQFTGGEKIAARHLYQGIFEFTPQGKLTMSVNIRPVIVGKDHGIRRRLRVVPFRQLFQSGKRGLVDELLAEGPGILNWLLDGYRMWREQGLGTCPEVDAASKAYFEEMDPIGSFITECCELNPQHVEDSGILWDAYKRWCQQSSEDEKNPTAFGRRLTDMGHGKAGKSHGIIRRAGLRVKDEWKRPTAARGEEATKG